MEDKTDSHTVTAKHATTVERKSSRELVVTRTFNAPARIVFDAWTKPELIQRWWIPKSCEMSFHSCRLDARTGGTYCFEFSHPAAEQPMAFFGRYLEVIPGARLVWTNEEAAGEGSVTTVTFEEKDGATLVVIHELYPSVQALDEAMATGSISWSAEQFGQLDQLLTTHP